MTFIHKTLFLLPISKNSLLFDGKLHAKKRGLKPGLISDLTDFMKQSKVKSALVFITPKNNLKIYGVPQARHQRLRNIYKVYH